jgi:hypothetical protein
MRRGLLAWDQSEVPVAVLDARVEKCRKEMIASGFDALLLYNNFPRPAAVSWLTHFVPYWSQGVLLVPKAGAPEFFVSLSNRVAGWIAETSHMGAIISTPRLGADLAKRLEGVKRAGVVELAKFPGGIARPLLEDLPGIILEDATTLFRSVRHPADETEIAISRKAAILARTSLDDAHAAGDHGRSGALTAAIEGPARLAGAEEVIVELAPDLGDTATLRRIEGDLPLADRYAVRLSLAYKGHWVRIGRTHDKHTDKVAGWLPKNVMVGPGGSAGDGIEIQHRLLEACVGSTPLSAVGDFPEGAVGIVNLTLAIDGDIHPVSIPVLNQGGLVSPLV